ncbi:DUF4430 domain-containing protein [Heyndrickxia sp. FSL W8-0423]|uniref:DUF4430 domain-containing protein n=1 Tax=Heyndrickxia sp. FSL W8-0423 TaxID=2921601 RepID=UPI0030F5E5EC
MKLLKSFAVLLLASLTIFLIAGCQKDEVKPITEDSKATNITASNTNENGLQKEADNSSDEREKKQEVQTSKSTTNESSNKKEEKTNNQNVSKTNRDSNINSSKTTTEKKPKSSERKQASIENKTKETKKETRKQTKKQTSQPKETVKQQNNHQKKAATPLSSVQISIVGDKKTGTILSQTKVVINNGDTMLTATRKILKEKGIPISVTGSGATAYVQGIANLFEFDLGPMSGWTVKKNGVLLNRSAGVVTVKNGDRIEWIYTTDYSKK